MSNGDLDVVQAVLFNVRRSCLIVLPVFLSSSVLAARPPSSASLKIEAAGPLVEAARRWAAEFMKKRPGTTVVVTETSTGAAAAALLSGAADIAEVPEPGAATGAVHATPVAEEIAAVYVNPESPVVELTLDQLRAVYAGQVADWAATGSTLGPITVYGPDPASPASALFRERVLKGGAFRNDILTLSSARDVAAAVGRDTRAIGFGGTVAVRGVKILPLKKGDRADAAPPMARAASAGAYPLSRKILLETRGDPGGLAKSFADWVRSPAGEKACREAGFFPYEKPPPSAGK